MQELFFKTWNNIFLKAVPVWLFLRILILSDQKMDRESICTSSRFDFITHVYKLHCWGSITSKNSRKYQRIIPEMKASEARVMNKSTSPAMDHNAGVEQHDHYR